MTKKIKDLTVDEMKHICEKCDFCFDCPLLVQKGCETACVQNSVEFLEEINKKLEEEIEVEDESARPNEN